MVMHHWNCHSPAALRRYIFLQTADCKPDFWCSRVQDNRFHGTLPIGVTNQNLISLRVTNNNFNSNIPDAIWRLPQLTTIEASNNG